MVGGRGLVCGNASPGLLPFVVKLQQTSQAEISFRSTAVCGKAATDQSG